MAYASDRGGEGNLDIWIKHIAGGEAIQLTRDPADDHQPHFSPDGSQIVFRSERGGGGIYVIATLGGTEQLLANEGRSPRFSPDGKWVAYWVGMNWAPIMDNVKGKIYVIAAGGGSPRRIGSNSFVGGHPIWSPDGRHLLARGNTLWGPADWYLTPLEAGPEVPTGAIELLRRQLSPRPFVVSAPAEWLGDQVLFHVRLDDSVSLWKVSISPTSQQITGPAEQLTSGSGLEIHPSMARDGTVVFSSLVENEDIWTLPMNTREGTLLGPLQQLTHDLARDWKPSLYADGKKMLFLSLRSGNQDIWMKDLETGQEVSFKATPARELAPYLSPDQKRLMFGQPPAQPGERGTIWVMPAEGGLPEKISEEGYVPWGWSGDSQSIVVKEISQGDAQAQDLHLLGVATRRKTKLLESTSFSLFQPGFSVDNRWITFEATKPPFSQSAVFIAPYRAGVVPAESDWIHLGHDSGWDDKPRWSPDNNLLYFTSDRDGFVCLWAQRLEPATKRPKGVPFPIYHFHDARRSMLNVGYAGLDLSVASDKIAFNMTELTGNIWMTKLDLK